MDVKKVTVKQVDKNAIEKEFQKTTIEANKVKIDVGKSTKITQYVVAATSVASVIIIGFQAIFIFNNTDKIDETLVKSLTDTNKVLIETLEKSENQSQVNQKLDSLTKELQILSKKVNSAQEK
jgi:hypothetical protein